MPYIDMTIAVAGIALGVWQHDWIMKKIQGAENFLANLKSKAAALEAEVAAKAAAVKTAVK